MEEQLFRIPHPRPVGKGQHDLACGELRREVGAGYLRIVDAGAFQVRFPKVHAAQVGLPKITVAEVQARCVEPPQVEAAKIAVAQIAGLPRRLSGVKLLDRTVPEELIHGVVGDLQFGRGRSVSAHPRPRRCSYRLVPHST